MGNSANRDSRKIALAERRRSALELRKAGASYDQIAKQLGYSGKANAWHDVHKGILDIVREPAEAVRVLEIERLDAMLLGLWKKAKSGDGQAIDRALRIMERRASYLGLDAPKSMHFDVSKMSDEQLAQILGGACPAAAGGGAEGSAAAPSESGASDPPSGEDEGSGA